VTPADYDDALDAHARAYAALMRAADDEAAAMRLRQSAAERKAAASELEQTLRRRLHGMLAGKDPAVIPEPQEEAARVPCRVCGTHPCSCPPPGKRRPRRKKEAGEGADPTPAASAATAAASAGRPATAAGAEPVRCVTIVCTRDDWCKVADGAHAAAFCAAVGLQEPLNPPVRFPLLALPERLAQLADAGLNSEVMPPPGGEDQVRRACEAPGLAGRVVLMPAPCEPGRPTAQTEGR